MMCTLKIASAIHTEAGAGTFCAIRSYLATLVRQGHGAFECLTLVLPSQTPQPRFPKEASQSGRRLA